MPTQDSVLDTPTRMTRGDAPVVDVVPGLISAMGGVIPADRPLSWYPPGHGYLPMLCYGLRDAGSFFLIDTGITIHEQSIRAGMARVVESSRERRACTTRREPDCIINLPWLLHDFKFTSFHYGGDISVCPLDFFDKMEETAIDAQMEAWAGTKVSYMRPGSVLEIGAMRLEPVRTSLRLLSTYWYYEATTRTLFSSDSWGWLTLRDPSDPWIVSPGERDVKVDDLRDFFAFKFDWLRGANCRPLADEIEALAARGIDRICPSYGRIIEGRKSTSIVFERTVEALMQLGAETRPSALSGWRGLHA